PSAFASPVSPLSLHDALPIYMRVPISYALTYPERAATPVDALDLSRGLSLEFEPPDLETFPLLALARRAGERGGTFPCAYNAAKDRKSTRLNSSHQIIPYAVF